jgi:hypothetical protein
MFHGVFDIVVRDNCKNSMEVSQVFCKTESNITTLNIPDPKSQQCNYHKLLNILIGFHSTNLNTQSPRRTKSSFWLPYPSFVLSYHVVMHNFLSLQIISFRQRISCFNFWGEMSV